MLGYGAGYNANSNPAALHGDVITDFAAGAGGDVLDLGYYLTAYLAGWDAASNPFVAGFLRLQQVGLDTVLQLSHDGTGAAWVDVLTLQGVSAGAVVAGNLAQGWNPHGLAGDTISGGGDTDTLAGGVNDDSLAGLEGDDSLSGNAGADLLQGGAGNDTLNGGDGADSLDGGDGNDTLYGNVGGDTLAGGDANDYLDDTGGANAIGGGAGDDTIDDVSAGDTGSTLAGGAGRDTFRLTYTTGYRANYSPAALHADVVTDFTAGAGGDVLDLGTYLTGYLDGWDSAGNPFVDGFLRMQQAGADTVLQLSHDGTGAAWVDVLTLQGVTAADIVAGNIAQGWNPLGATGSTLGGGEGADTLTGGPDNDTLAGGGDGDTLYGAGGADVLAGEGGYDCLSGDAGADSLDGGAGGDTLDGGAGADTLAGGAGNDSLSDGQGANSVGGGDGADVFDAVSGGDAGSTLAGGAGRDTFRLDGQAGYNANHNPGALHADVISDFAAGVGGDVIDLEYYLLAYSSGWSNGTNPFTTGYLQVVQSGADTLLQLNHDAAGPWVTVLTLAGVTAGDVTPDNFFSLVRSGGWGDGGEPGYHAGRRRGR